MFNNRKDPLVDSIKQVMQENDIRRKVEAELNEALGIASKKALPFEKHAAYDRVLAEAIKETLHPNQQVLDVHEPEEDELTKKDFEMLRAGKNAAATKKAFPNVKNLTPGGHPDWKKEGHSNIPTKYTAEEAQLDEAGRTLMPGAKPRRSGSFRVAVNKAEAARQRALKDAESKVKKGIPLEVAASAHDVTVDELKKHMMKKEEANKGLGAMAVPGNVKPHSQTMEEDKRWDEHEEKWVPKSKKKYPKNWSSANERGNSGPSDSDNPDKFRPGKMEENAPIYGGAKGSGELETGGGAKPSSLARKMLTKPVMSTSPVLSEKEQSVDASRRGEKVQAKFGGGGSDPSKKVRPAGEESVEQSRRGAGAKYMKESKRIRPTVPSDNILKGAEAGRENAGGKTPSWLTKAIKDMKAHKIAKKLDEEHDEKPLSVKDVAKAIRDKKKEQKEIKKRKMTAEEVMEEILANMGEEAFNALMEAGAVSSDFGRGRTYGPVNSITGVGQGDNTGAIIKSPSATQVAQNLSAAGAPAAVTSAAYKVAAPNAVRPGGGTTMPVKAPATGDTAIVQQKIASLKQARDVETKMASDRAAAAASVASAAKPGADGTDAIRDTKTAQSIADRGATAFVNATAARASNPGMPATTPKAPVAGLRLPTAPAPAAPKPASFEFTAAEKAGKVSKERLDAWKATQQGGGKDLSLGNFLNAAQNKRAVIGGANDQTAGQKALNARLRTAGGQ